MKTYPLSGTLPEQPIDSPNNCDDDGHIWGDQKTSKDGLMTVVKCRVCGKEEET